MEVRIKWERQESDSKYYITEELAKDADGIRALINSPLNLSKYRPRPKCPVKQTKTKPDSFAAFFYEVCVRTYNSMGVVTVATLLPSYRLLMPVWNAYPNQTKEIKRKWDRLWRDIHDHELEHLRIFKSSIKTTEEKLKKDQKFMPQPTFDSLMDKLLSQIVNDQVNFDGSTNYGNAILRQF